MVLKKDSTSNYGHRAFSLLGFSDGKIYSEHAAEENMEYFSF